jgi:hypothetical protein
MPSLDSCINDLFEPGNIPADSGQTPSVPAIVDIFFVDLRGSGSLRVEGTTTHIPQVYNIAATFGGSGTLQLGQLGGLFSFIGSLVTNTATVNSIFINNTDTVATWDTEVRDTNTIHDTGSNTNRLTIPAALNGRICIIHATVYASHGSVPGSSIAMFLKRNSTESFDGTSAHYGNSGFGTQRIATLHSAPIQVSSSDIFEVFVNQDTGGNINLTLQSTFGIWVLA